MRTQMAAEAGTTQAPSEDRALVGPNLLVVLDGLTARTETGCIHGVAWFADQLAAAIMRFSTMEPTVALKAAIQHTADLHVDTCDLQHEATPCAAVGLVQIHGDRLRYLVLGDVTIVIDTRDDLLVVSDTRINSTALAERAEADALPTGSQDKADALVRMKRVEMAARNTEGGYWIAGANPDAAEHSLTGELALNDVRRAAILTDGAARAVDLFHLFDWPKALDLLASSGPDDLIRRVRQVEKEDSAAVEWPRNKVSDDATVVYLERTSVLG